MKKTIFGFAFIAAIALSSCTAEVVATHPAYESDVAVGVAPGPDYIWVGREYTWQNGAYVVVPGYWAKRPYNEAIWTTGHWHRVSGQYRWERGHWD